MMIEPPGNFRRGGVFEIDDCVLIARELAFVKESPGAMDQTVVGVGRALGDAFAMEARKQRGRASSVKALIVIKDANLQNALLRGTKSVETGMLRILRVARSVKARRFRIGTTRGLWKMVQCHAAKGVQ
jgi:hypothetical protein